jgi:23S rRNA pseudouridine1911/1915/1917 synthase
MRTSPADCIHLAVETTAVAPERLDRYLAARLPALSRMRLKALIQQGYVRLGGVTITEPSQRVKPGQRIDLELPPPVPAAPEPQAIALTIVYEDEDLAVVDKPAGLVVHPAPGNPDRTLVNALLAHLGERLSGIGGVRRPGIVHRLDKDTSGLLVVAKTDPAHAGLSAAFAAHDVERAYLALVWGRPRPAAGEIEGAIGRDPRNRKRMAVVGRGGKPALTRYRTLRHFGEAVSLLECRLATGRTHQIRVHLAAQGHAVLGDPVYGRATPARRAGLGPAALARIAALGRQALHAHVLGFRHPVSGGRLTFRSELPSEIKDLIAVLEDTRTAAQ